MTYAANPTGKVTVNSSRSHCRNNGKSCHIFLTLKLKSELPGEEESHRTKNTTRDKPKNLWMKTKAWKLKNNPQLKVDSEEPDSRLVYLQSKKSMDQENEMYLQPPTRKERKALVLKEIILLTSFSKEEQTLSLSN